jgi:cytochrome c oxidase subunit III
MTPASPAPAPPGQHRRASFTAVYAAMASIIMLFGAFTSAMVVRRGASKDWKGTPAPSLLWVNTAVLAGSSLAAERARRHLRNNDRPNFNRWWTGATILGAGFVAGQIVVWRGLVDAGVYLNSHPGSAFFYLGTVMHALHLLGVWLWMFYLFIKAWRLELGPSRRTGVDVCTVFWHFLGLLWLYLLFLFIYWGNR